MKTFHNIRELSDLPEMLAGGFISARKHPSQPLIIYNYTARAQYDNVWNAATLACRGLIADLDGNIVARPFTKFFNLEQLSELPDEPFEVFEKMDGSLGIVYWVDGAPYIATRGSFESEQAQEANKMLAAHDTSKLNPRNTYLFEIIYPQNRIVVDYGGLRDLVLLAVIETESGIEVPLSDVGTDVGFAQVKRYEGVTDVQALRKLSNENTEGFVIRYASGLRVKVKLAEYVRLHRLLTGLTEKMLFEEFIVTEADLAPLLERVPDEFNVWIQERVADFTARYQHIEREAKAVFENTKASDRKAYAQAFTQSRYAPILFKMLDGKPYTNLIWKMIDPQGAMAFKRDEI
jgi:RNA ligase